MNQIAEIGQSSRNAQPEVVKLPDWLPTSVEKAVQFLLSRHFAEENGLSHGDLLPQRLVDVAQDQRLRPLWKILLRRDHGNFRYPAVERNIWGGPFLSLAVEKAVRASTPETDGLSQNDIQEDAMMVVFLEIVSLTFQKPPRIIFTEAAFNDHISDINLHIKALITESRMILELEDKFHGFGEHVKHRAEYWQKYRDALIHAKPKIIVNKRRKNSDGLAVSYLFSRRIKRLFAEPFWHQSVVVGEIATGERATVPQLREIARHIECWPDLEAALPFGRGPCDLGTRCGG